MISQAQEGRIFTMEMTREFALWSNNLDYSDIPAEALPWVKAATTDFLAVTLAGCRSPGVDILKRYVLSQYKKGKATIIGHGIQMSPEGAALLNGTMAHWEEYDDANFPMAGHPTVTIMPALLAAGEVLGSSGRDLMTAYVVGFEMAAKVGLLINPQQKLLGWHPTATLGTLGATAGVAKLLGLNGEQTEVALGLGATQTLGLRLNFGTMTKPLHAGLAGRAGLLAASLARDGFSAAKGILEHSHGYVHALSGGKRGNQKEFVEKIGNPLEILSSGIGFKRHPGSFQTQAGTEAVLQMVRDEGVRAKDVDRIHCRVNHLMQRYSLIHKNPQTRLEGKLSLEFCLAAALVCGQLEVEQFTDELVQDPQIRGLIKRIVVEPHPDMANLDLTKGEKFLTMEVTLHLKNGKNISRQLRTDFALPGIRNGGIAEEMINKFVRNARRVLSENDINECLARVKRMEELDNVSDLLDPVKG
jgi:2-methylcitrate dehydratase PrpD